MPDLTIDRVRDLLRSPDGRLPLLMELRAEVANIRSVVDESARREITEQTYVAAVTRIEAATQLVAQALAWTAAWGLPGVHDAIAVSTLRRLANIADEHSGTVAWLKLRRWPAVLCLATAGTAAVDAGRDQLLGQVLRGVVVRGVNATEPAAVGLSPESAIPTSVAGQLLGERRYRPADDRVGERLSQWLAPDLIDSVPDVNDAFDRYQFLTGLVYFDERTQAGAPGWAPVGSFGWRYEYGGWPVPDVVAAELDRQAATWPLLTVGLFGGDPARVKAALTGYGELVEQARRQM